MFRNILNVKSSDEFIQFSDTFLWFNVIDFCSLLFRTSLPNRFRKNSELVLGWFVTLNIREAIRNFSENVDFQVEWLKGESHWGSFRSHRRRQNESVALSLWLITALQSIKVRREWKNKFDRQKCQTRAAFIIKIHWHLHKFTVILSCHFSCFESRKPQRFFLEIGKLKQIIIAFYSPLLKTCKGGVGWTSAKGTIIDWRVSPRQNSCRGTKESSCWEQVQESFPFSILESRLFPCNSPKSCFSWACSC